VPDPKDLEKLEKVLGKLGENELEIGQIEEGEYIPKEPAPEEPSAREHVPEEPSLTEPSPREQVPEKKVSAEGEPDLDELLKDIEIGLSEERELEERPEEAKEAAGKAEKEPEPEIEEEIIPPSEPSLEKEKHEILEEKGKEEVEAAAPSEPEVETFDEEALDLPSDFDFGDLELKEGPEEGVFKPKGGKEEPIKPEEEEEAPEGEMEEVPAGEVEKELGLEEEEPIVEEEFELEEEAPAVEMEEAPPVEEEKIEAAEFDLPADFDMGDLELREGPPEEMFKEAAEEAPPVEEKEEEEIIEEGEEEEELEMPELEELEIFDKEEAAAPEEGVEEEISEEMIPEIEEEAVAPEEGGEEEISEEMIPEIEEELPPAEREKEEIEIELSDEDIVLVTTKLKQLAPNLAIRIRDIIIGETLPQDSMKELIDLLISDAPEKELLKLVESVTGERIIPRARVPEVISIPRRPTAITRIAANLGPVVRVAGLFVIILAIVTILFMVFIYRPMRAGRYYKEGIELLRNEQYSEAEYDFEKAVEIYPKVKEYDNFGWEYMISGNYSEAMEKFQQGIERDERVKNLEIRLHLAMLDNILGNYGEADTLYDKVIDQKPKDYEFKKLKGLNLIDWGKIEPEHLNASYNLFKDAYAENQKSPDPLFYMLYIHILRNDADNIDYLYNFLRERYPGSVNKQVFTDLAEYYLARDNVDPVRALMTDVIQKNPDYPEAYYTFSKYYKEIKNKELQEELLKGTIEVEKARKLVYPWEVRNRNLLSNAYNDLGEIYAGMEITGMSAESIKYFKQAIEENEQNVKAYFNLAQVYFYGEKNYELARVYYERAKRMGYESNDLTYNLGVLYFYNKDFRKAIQQWSVLTETMMDNPNINFAMGSALLHLGEYSAALGELLVLDGVYDDLVQKLGEIKPWRAYHKRIVLEAAHVSNNLGVAYEKLYETTGNSEYQKKSLVSLYKGGELADIMGIQRGEIQYNINYIIHPEVIRAGMAINNDVSNNYRFFTQ
jgi:tetratricopeptide (TPR) repeat protein